MFFTKKILIISIIYIYVCFDISFEKKKKKIEKDINNAFLKILYENEYEYMISAYSFQTIRKIWWIRNLLTQKNFIMKIEYRKIIVWPWMWDTFRYIEYIVCILF